MNGGVKLVIFDWAGTLIDFGSLAPVAAFTKAFAAHGLMVSANEAKGPMGLHKRDHLLAMLQMPAVAYRWREVHGKEWNDKDLQSLYDCFMPFQLKAIKEHSRLIPGAAAVVDELRRQEIKIGAATGYFQEAANRVYASAKEQGLVPDCCVCVDEVPQGRPAPVDDLSHHGEAGRLSGPRHCQGWQHGPRHRGRPQRRRL